MSTSLNGKYKFQNSDEVPEVPTVPLMKSQKIPADQKKPRTPAQLEATRKLAEANRAKALARRGLMVECPNPKISQPVCESSKSLNGPTTRLNHAITSLSMRRKR